MNAERVGRGRRGGSSEPCAWVVRGEPGGGEFVGGKSLLSYNIDNDVVTLGWGDWAIDAPIAAFNDREMLKNEVKGWCERNWEPDWKESDKTTASSCIWRFCNGICVGDIVVLPPKGEKWIAFGRVAGPAERDKGRPSGARLYRPVKWLVKRKLQVFFSEDLWNSIHSQGTIFRLGGDDAFRRIKFSRELQGLV